MSTTVKTELRENARKLISHMESRSHVAPKRLCDPGPSEEELALIFEGAQSAPDHGQILPWRFVLVPISKRNLLAEVFVSALLNRNPSANQTEIAAAHEKAFRSPCLLIAIVSHGTKDSSISIVERNVSLGCAIQNMLLVAESLQIGSGLTSGQAMNDKAMRNLFQLTEYEIAVCFVNFGRNLAAKSRKKRPCYQMFVSSL